jgi:hypothetical protein
MALSYTDDGFLYVPNAMLLPLVLAELLAEHPEAYSVDLLPVPGAAPGTFGVVVANDEYEAAQPAWIQKDASGVLRVHAMRLHPALRNL